MNPDGSFIYVPAADYHGTDSFTYVDTQGRTQSNVATVTIDVNPVTFVVTNTNDSRDRLAPMGDHAGQSLGQPQPGADPVQHPGDRPVHDRAGVFPADDHAQRGD